MKHKEFSKSNWHGHGGAGTDTWGSKGYSKWIYHICGPEAGDPGDSQFKNRSVKVGGDGKGCMPRAAAKYGCDILHCNQQHGPDFLQSASVVVTLHDIIYMKQVPGRYFLPARAPTTRSSAMCAGWWCRPLWKRPKKDHHGFQFEKDTISSYFNENNQRLVTVYNGVSTYFKPVSRYGTTAGRKENTNCRTCSSFPGQYTSQKNTAGTLKAFSDFIRHTGSSKTGDDRLRP